MADKQFKVNEVIELGYQAPNKESGLTVTAEIYLPNLAKDSLFPDVTLVEVESTGTYRGSFTPDQEGTWQVITHKAGGDGQVVKNYSVGAHNVHSVGAAIADVDSDVAAVGAAVADVDSDVAAVGAAVADVDSDVAAVGVAVADVDSDIAVVDGKVDTVDGKVDAVDAKLDSIDTKVSALDTPPMAF
jgi:hypothetical protein